MRVLAYQKLVTGLLKRFTSLLLVAVLGFSTASCDSTPKASQSDLQNLGRRALAPHRLLAGEKVRVIVYGEASLSGEYQIDPSGLISVPLVGAVKALGLTQDELARDLGKEYSNQYLREPRITVSIVEFKPFYIMGEVEKPGSYTYSSGLNLKNALAVAGGTTFRANTSYVLIQHAGESEVKSFEVGVTPIPILPGDLIEVPKRYI